VLPRQPGTKEVRYAHLMSGDVEIVAPDSEEGVAVVSSASYEERIKRLESHVEKLQSDFAELKHQFAAFRKQFE
jgi:uncharacterized protein YceH (UPF0502 family)